MDLAAALLAIGLVFIAPFLAYAVFMILMYVLAEFGILGTVSLIGAFCLLTALILHATR